MADMVDVFLMNIFFKHPFVEYRPLVIDELLSLNIALAAQD